MRKKPPTASAHNCRLIDRKPTGTASTLGKTGAELWRTIMSEYAIERRRAPDPIAVLCGGGSGCRVRVTDRAGWTNGA